MFRRHPVPQSVKIPAVVPHPVDERLMERIKEARERLPENNVRRLILENPDTFVKPLSYDELGAMW